MEIAKLRELVSKDEAVIEGLRGQVDALQHLTAAQDKILTSIEKVVSLQQEAVQTYRDLAAAADKRADENLKRAERAEGWVWKAGLGGFVLGILTGVGITLAF